MLKLYNTLTRKIEVFKPIKKGYVGLYTCGPTVYWYAHIGNLRTYIFEDILKRVLLYNKYKVKQVMNITDVGHLTSDADEGEDKLVKALKREGKPLNKKSMTWLANFYTKAFKDDIKKLNILFPDIWCKATEHIKDMINLVKRIEKNGYSYETSSAVYFDISKFKNYGQLTKLKLKDLKAGARVEIDPQKKHPYDFSLWFKAVGKHAHHIMNWDSPWGRGFPGWHIECSAMSIKYLGKHFDIHTGGIDHIPIHHTNEIAQSESATGKHPWVNYWLHGEFLVIDKKKMAKSVGEFLTLDSLIKRGYNPLDYRYFCLTAHYKQQLNFSFEGLDSAKNSRERLQRFVWKIQEDKRKWEMKKSHKATFRNLEKEFEYAINDDLNMPRALAVTWDLVRNAFINDFPREKLKLLKEFDKVLGLSLLKLKKPKISEKVKRLVNEREKARKKKDWKKADEIRNEIKKLGYIVEDSEKGSVVKNL